MTHVGSIASHDAKNTGFGPFFNGFRVYGLGGYPPSLTDGFRKKVFGTFPYNWSYAVSMFCLRWLHVQITNQVNLKFLRPLFKTAKMPSRSSWSGDFPKLSVPVMLCVPLSVYQPCIPSRWQSKLRPGRSGIPQLIEWTPRLSKLVFILKRKTRHRMDEMTSQCSDGETTLSPDIMLDSITICIFINCSRFQICKTIIPNF